MSRWRPLQVLIVEDDPVVAMDLAYLVQDAGHRVVAQESRFSNAMEAAKRHKPDVALVDVSLHEGLVGPKIAQRFTREGGPLVIFVTGQPEALPADLAGAYGVLRKPVPERAIAMTLSFLASHLRGGDEPKPAVLQLAGERGEPGGPG